MTDWIILRTSAQSTLRLVETLTDAGFEAWTPIEVREIRKGKNREVIEQAMPILPEYVFADAERMADLLTLSRSPALNYQVYDREQRRMVTKGHPHFSVFRLHGQIRPLADRALVPLRTLEADLAEVTARRREKARRKGPAPQFKAGDIVRVDGGGFEGLSLEVVEDNVGKVVKLTHGNWMWMVEVSAFNLRRVQLEQATPEQGVAIAA